MLHGSAWFQGGLFVLAGLFAVALLAGYRTGLATFVSWFLLVSLQARNPLVLHGGDTLLRLLLFWSIFLPLGARGSVDALRRRASQPPAERVVSGGSAALILQVCFVYWFSVALKWDPVWWRDGTAVYYALSIDLFATPTAHFLLQFPTLLKGMTYGTLVLEAFGPVLLFVPFRHGPVRCAVVVAFVLFHLLGLGLCLELGIFPYVCAVAWLALLPGWFWQRAWVVRLGRLAGSSPATPAGTEPRPAVLRAPAALNALALFFLAYVFLWNVRTIDFDTFSRFFPRSVNWVGSLFRVEQMWGLFAPAPMKDDGWFVVQGELADGRTVDLLGDGGPVSWEKPALVSATLQNERWRKYLINLWLKDNAPHRVHYARYLARDWDARHGADAELQDVQIYYMLEMTRPDGAPAAPEKILLWHEPRRPAG
jgi:hypothetical protein